MQVKKESHQNQSRWWIWSRDAAKGILTWYFLLHQKAANWAASKNRRPLEDAYSSSYSEWNVDKTWSSQERKSDELMEVRTERPVVNAQHTDRFFVENDEMNSYAEAESELSLESRSFLHRVNDQVRKRQNQSSKDATKDSDKHSLIWRMYMSSTLQASVFMEKNYSDNWHSIKKYRKFTMKQMFDISEKLITEQSDEIHGMSTINWEHSSWKYLSLVGDAHVISLLHKKVYVFFRFCLVPWKDEREPTIKLCMGRQIDVVQKFIRIQNFVLQNWWWANRIRVGYLPRIHNIAALPQSPRVTVKIECNTRKVYWTDYLHVDVQRHLMEISRQQKRMRVKCSTRLSLCKEIWSRLMVIPRTWIREKWYSISEDSPPGEWDRIAEQMMLTFAESKHPIFRSTSPLSRGVLSKRGGKLSIHCCADSGAQFFR